MMFSFRNVRVFSPHPRTLSPPWNTVVSPLAKLTFRDSVTNDLVHIIHCSAIYYCMTQFLLFSVLPQGNNHCLKKVSKQETNVSITNLLILTDLSHHVSTHQDEYLCLRVFSDKCYLSRSLPWSGSMPSQARAGRMAKAGDPLTL